MYAENLIQVIENESFIVFLVLVYADHSKAIHAELNSHEWIVEPAAYN